MLHYDFHHSLYLGEVPTPLYRETLEQQLMGIVLTG